MFELLIERKIVGRSYDAQRRLKPRVIPDPVDLFSQHVNVGLYSFQVIDVFSLCFDSHNTLLR
jgi:hypothetical protein